MLSEGSAHQSHTSTWLRWVSFEHVLLQSPQPREQTCDIVYWFLKLPPRSDTHHLCLYFIGQTKSHGYSYLRRGWRNIILTICLEDRAQEMFGDCTNDHSFSRYCRGMYAHPWTIRHGSTKRIISWKADSIGQEAKWSELQHPKKSWGHILVRFYHWVLLLWQEARLQWAGGVCFPASLHIAKSSLFPWSSTPSRPGPREQSYLNNWE